jgi:hypothetical protein
MNFGFTGCHASLPSMQRLAVYAEEALAELEAAVRPTPGKAKRTPKAVVKAVTPAPAKAARSSAAKATASKATVLSARSAAKASPANAPKRAAAVKKRAAPAPRTA